MHEYHTTADEVSEQSLTRDLPEDILEAWERFREVATEIGEQRIYASHRSIMFSRKTCHFFVRPLPNRLELCIFLARTVKDPIIKKTYQASSVKIAHMVNLVHRDQIGRPLTDWLVEAYAISDGSLKPTRKPAKRKKVVAKKRRKATAKKKVAKKSKKKK